MRFSVAVRLFCSLVLSGFFFQSAAGQSLVVNEIQSSNQSTIVDDDGDYEDWIELYNYGNEPIDLTGFGLSDNPSRPFKWIFPSGTIGPGEFLLVWASNKDREAGGVYHTSWAISKDGEDILLSDPVGNVVDAVPAMAIPPDRSFGRVPDASPNWQILEEPTPGHSNGDGGPLRLAPPSFSQDPGFYAEPFELSLTVDEPGVQVFYTLDGSTPDTTSIVFNEPVRVPHVREGQRLADHETAPDTLWREPPDDIFTGTVVRAVAYRDGALPSDMIVGTFLVAPDILTRYDLPVVSLSFEEDDLFGYRDGIYVPGAVYDSLYNELTLPRNRHANYTQRGREWERPVHVEFFEPDGRRGFAINVGARIHGGASRAQRLKSLRLYFRSDYDDINIVDYPLFLEKPDVNHKRLLLRNSGTDFGYSMIRDGFMTRLVNHLDLDMMAYRPAVVFLNGEFWGIQNIRERIDDRYIESNHGVDPAELDLIEMSGVRTDAIEGDNVHYQAFLDYIRSNDLSQNDAFEEVSRRIDVDNFTDYQVSQIYFGNRDWPGNNIKYWRKRVNYDPSQPAGHDGRWRWLLYDTDYGFNLNNNSGIDHNTLAFALADEHNNWPNPRWGTEILRTLLANDDYRRRFATRFADLLNSSFRAERVLGILDESAAEVSTAIPHHTDRWGSFVDWHQDIDAMRAFGEARPEFVRQHLQDEFELGEEVTLTVDVSDASAGYVQVNSVRLTPSSAGVDEEVYPWSGVYFDDLPVHLMARANPGYRFVEWRGADLPSGQSIVVDLDRSTSITAVFEPYDGPVPSAHPLSSGTYSMTAWSPDEAAGTYPPNMAFFQSRVVDPILGHDTPDLYQFAYDLTSATRVLGLGDEGVAFINTGTTNNLVEGADGRGLGAAVLALDTRGVEGIEVSWRGRTIRTNERQYAIRLQYRVGDAGEFRDMLGRDGGVIEYRRSTTEGHHQSYGPVELPADADGQDYVQLRWMYHYTGPVGSGPRSMLAIDDIHVTADIYTSVEDDMQPLTFSLQEPYPSPTSGPVNLALTVPHAGDVVVEVFDVLGRRVATVVDDVLPAGRHAWTWSPNMLSAGVYILRARTADEHQVKRFVYVR